MRISVIVRTKNEQRNLNRFVLAYHDWVDIVLVQDDESESLEYLFDVRDRYKKVILDFYYGNIIESGETRRAYHHEQLNSMIDFVEGRGVDWIIMDDCDSFPNRNLKRDFRHIVENCEEDFIYIPKVHFYKDAGYFDKLSNPGGGDTWEAAIWAWRANKGFCFNDRGVAPQGFDAPEENRIKRLQPPYCTLHHPWPNDEAIEIKRRRYTDLYGKEYSNFNPLEFGGSIKKPKEWMVE